MLKLSFLILFWMKVVIQADTLRIPHIEIDGKGRKKASRFANSSSSNLPHLQISPSHGLLSQRISNYRSSILI